MKIYLHIKLLCIFVFEITSELCTNSHGKMGNEEDISKNVLSDELIEKGLKTFLATLRKPAQVYCIVNDSVKDMHLALNPPDDFTQMNV